MLQMKKIYKLMKGEDGENQLTYEDLDGNKLGQKKGVCIEQILRMKKGKKLGKEDDFIRQLIKMREKGFLEGQMGELKEE